MKQKRDFEWMKDVVAVIIFLLLFPYFAISFKQQKEQFLDKESEGRELQTYYEQLSELPHNQKYFVAWEEDGVCLRLPVEHFLIGALAASIPISYEEEVLKAQVIVLRSTLCRMYEETEPDEQGMKVVALKAGEGDFWTDRRMQSAWGETYEDNLKKCTSAVMDTQGVYLTYAGNVIDGYYHGMSAGRTRDGTELTEEGDFGYLKATECADNLSDRTYISEKKVKIAEIGTLEKNQQTEEGYVISVKRNGQQMTGEQLREELGIASSNFTWKEKNDEYIFTVKGSGHGFGLDQYYGNILASKDKNYKEIIDYFFADVTFQKME